jgi:tripartite-type tricarboxylate transporter receptor subunit TctC
MQPAPGRQCARRGLTGQATRAIIPARPRREETPMPGPLLPRRSLAVAAIALSARGAAAQAEWPTRPVTLVVTYAPGGSADVLARLIAPIMAQRLGQPVVVENRAGGGGNVGSDFVARAAPDGHTIQIGAVSTHAINRELFGTRLPFDPQRSFTPITLLVRQPNLVLIGNRLPARNVAEFVAWARTQPSVSYGTAGVGSSNHLTGALIGDVFGLRMELVPYRSGGQALTDLIAGNVPVVIDNLVTAAPLAQDGRARAIAVTSAERSPLLPEVPSFAESGAPGFDLVSWQALFGPAGIPAPIVTRLNAAAHAALADPAVRQRLAEGGSTPAPGSPDQLAAYMAEEIPKWARLVRISGARAE